MKRFEVVKEKLTVAMNKVAEFVGRPVAFLAMIVIIAVWFIASNFLPYDVWFDIMDVTIFITTFFCYLCCRLRKMLIPKPFRISLMK